MLSLFSCIYLPSVCLLWRNVCLGLPLFDWVVCFSYIKMHELLLCFEDQFFVSCFICNYFVPFRQLSFHLVYSFLYYF